MPKIQTILVAGDSHTWGQGSGGELELDSPVNGELRPLAFTCPSYVNLLQMCIRDRYKAYHNGFRRGGGPGPAFHN